MVIETPPKLTLNRSDILRFREELSPLEYSRFRGNEKEIIIIRSPSRTVRIIEDLELMVEMVEIEDTVGLDEAYLVGDEDYEIIAPEVMEKIAQMRGEMERSYLEKYGRIITKPYSSKEFIDPRDPIELLRLIVRIPMTKNEYGPLNLSDIITNFYIPEDISILYLILDDGYERITKDDIVSAKQGGDETIISPSATTVLQEKHDEDWLFRELAQIGQVKEEERGNMTDRPLQREPDQGADIGMTDRNRTVPFPKYTHKYLDPAMEAEPVPDDSEFEPVESLQPYPGYSHKPATNEMETTVPVTGIEGLARIRSVLVESGLEFEDADMDGADIRITGKNDRNILLGYVETCDARDLMRLEKCVEMENAHLGLMISNSFSYDSKLYLIGRNLDIKELGSFIEEGLPVEPSWFG